MGADLRPGSPPGSAGGVNVTRCAGSTAHDGIEGSEGGQLPRRPACAPGRPNRLRTPVTLFWRAWGVTPDGWLNLCFQSATDQRWAASGWENIARCNRHSWPAPAAHCFCGWHVLTTEAAVWAFVRSRHRGSPWAVGPVRWMGLGTVLPSNWPNDPPETRRLAAAAVAGPLALSPGARPYAKALTARYAVPVTGAWLPLSRSQAAVDFRRMADQAPS